MATKLEYILTNSYKAEMISYIKSHPEDFDETVKLAISNKQRYSWRAAWLLWSCMENDDERIKDYIKEIVKTLPGKKDNHLRDLLLILHKMELDEEYEGELFNLCVNTWEKIGKKPSVRFTAFKMIVKIAKKHPELLNEIGLLTQTHYMDTLSDTVKKSIFTMISEFNKKRET